MHRIAMLVFAGLLIRILPITAQDNNAVDATAVYKVEFTLRDGSDAAAKSGRRYVLVVMTNGKSVLRAGDKVPYATGSFQPGQGTAMATQYTYLDTGVNIDCALRNVSGKSH